MEYLSWHYSFGVEYYLKRLLFALKWVNHFFSLIVLLKSIFSPWKRLVETEKKSGFDFATWFRIASFNFVSRFVGASVRIILLFTGSILLLTIAILGSFGLILWILIPFLSLPVYDRFKQTPQSIVKKLIAKIESSSRDPLINIFESMPGKFLLSHLDVTPDQLFQESSSKVHISDVKIELFEDLIKTLVDSGVWSEDFLRKHELIADDLIKASKRWNIEQSRKENLNLTTSLGRAGIGVGLLVGYTPTLDKYSQDLSLIQDFTHHLIGRQNVVSRLERALTSGMSVILIGKPGVGKKTVILEFARRAAEGEFGSEMAYRKVVELDYNFLFSQSTDISQKKGLLANIFAEAGGAGNLILVLKDLHRITNASLEGFDFTDVIESHLDKKDLKIIAISTNSDFDRFLAPNSRLRKHFESVEVVEPNREEAFDIILESASNWEVNSGIIYTIQALRKILEGSDRYISDTPFPEKALELLDAVIILAKQKGDKKITLDLVNEVLAEKTGISFSRLSESEKKQLNEIEDLIHKRLVNQEAAVELIGKILRAKTSGVVDSNRPIGSFLFLGPTGVGKTQTAKVLSQVYYGSEDKIIRFDMAEYAGQEGLERLIGSVSTNTPGKLTTQIKNHPASLLLLDEIEKAPTSIYNLFLRLLDEGKITDAFGNEINCQHLFVVATSNAGAEYIRTLVQENASDTELQKKVTEYILSQKIFSPEFLNRFDGVVVYEPLTEKHLMQVASIMLSELSESMKKKSIYLKFDQSAIEKVAKEGYDPAFGARPMRRLIDVDLGNIIGQALLREELVAGDKILVKAAEERGKYFLVKEVANNG